MGPLFKNDLIDPVDDDGRLTLSYLDPESLAGIEADRGIGECIST